MWCIKECEDFNLQCIILIMCCDRAAFWDMNPDLPQLIVVHFVYVYSILLACQTFGVTVENKENVWIISWKLRDGVSVWMPPFHMFEIELLVPPLQVYVAKMLTRVISVLSLCKLPYALKNSMYEHRSAATAFAFCFYVSVPNVMAKKSREKGVS